MPGLRWSEKDIATLLRMRAAGSSSREIGLSMGRKEGAVFSYIRDRHRRHLGAPRPCKVEPTTPTDSDATEQLRCAVILSIMDYAKSHGLHIDQAARVLLSGERLAA